RPERATGLPRSARAFLQARSKPSFSLVRYVILGSLEWPMHVVPTQRRQLGFPVSSGWPGLEFARSARAASGRQDRSEMQNSGRFPAEIRHRVVQHAEDHGAVFTREALLQRRKPAPHRFERWTNRLGGNDALDADGGGRLLAREQDFLQALAGPNPSEG